MIKIRGDKVWKDLTAMYYHYETQPLPNPISYYLHQAPKKFHRYVIGDKFGVFRRLSMET